MGYALRDERRYTYVDYVTWSDENRYELIDGSAFLMAPAPSFNYQILAFKIGRQAANALEDKPCRVLVSPIDVRLPKAAESDELIDTVCSRMCWLSAMPARLRRRAFAARRTGWWRFCRPRSDRQVCRL